MTIDLESWWEREIMKTLKEMPQEQRPYERCQVYGTKALTDAELLAIILRTGSRQKDALELSQSILNLKGPRNGLGNLVHKSYEDLCEIPGIGKVKAMQLLCIGEIARRLWRREANSQKLYFTSPELCATYYIQEMKYLEQEELRLAFMDSKQKLIRDCILTRGTVNCALVSVREILISALKHHAVNVIMVHNHPSGNPQPSEEDIRVTQRVKEGFEAIGIALNDHIIIGDNVYYSFREHGGL